MRRALLVTAIVVLVAGCTGSTASNAPSSSSGPSVSAPAGSVNLRVTVWSANPGHLALLNSIADAYKAVDPEIGTITFDTLPGDQYATVLTTQLAGGNPPDLGWLETGSGPEFISQGVAQDVGPSLRSDANYNLSDYIPSTMAAWSRATAIYGVPFSTSPYAMFYNASLFESAGLQTPNPIRFKL